MSPSDSSNSFVRLCGFFLFLFNLFLPVLKGNHSQAYVKIVLAIILVYNTNVILKCPKPTKGLSITQIVLGDY